MSALAIDFVAPPARKMSLFGLTLLVAGGACLVLAMLELDARAQDLASAESRLKNLTRGLALRGERPPSAKPAGSAASGAAAKILPRLQAPWHELLGELESAAGGPLALPGEVDGTAGQPVALLGVDADARSRTLRLSGEAKSIDAVLAFVERLRASRRLDDVYLLGHEQRVIGAATVIAFTLSAAWPDGERGAAPLTTAAEKPAGNRPATRAEKAPQTPAPPLAVAAAGGADTGATPTAGRSGGR